jgi:hypothetical protein
MSTSRQRKPFSQQKGGQRKRTMKHLKDNLNGLSNGEIDILLKSYFITKDGHKIMNKMGFESKVILDKLLTELKGLYSTVAKEEKYKVLSTVSSIYSRQQLWNLGFQFSPFLYTKATRSNRSSTTTSPTTTSPTTTSPTTISTFKTKKQIRQEEVEKALLSYLNDNSYDAANRTICLKRKEYPEDEVIRDGGNNKYKKMVSLLIIYTGECTGEIHQRMCCRNTLENVLAKYTGECAGEIHWRMCW